MRDHGSFVLEWKRCSFVAVVLLTAVVGGCTALREAANLRDVRFTIDRLSAVRLAGIDVSDVRSYEDLGSRELLRLGSALSEGSLPLAFVLHLRATNPSANKSDARLTEMDWTLLLDDTETVSGTYEGDVRLPPGEPTDVPVQIQLDLVRFFDDNLREFVDLVSALTGDGPPQGVKVNVTPTVNTRFGTITYPSPITVVSKRVGRSTKK